MNKMGLAETISHLRTKGYTEDFNLMENCLECCGGKTKVFADELKVDAVYRFDEMSDPSDQAVLYAISSDKTGVKGVLVNSFGTYTDPEASEIIMALMRSERESSGKQI